MSSGITPTAMPVGQISSHHVTPSSESSTNALPTSTASLILEGGKIGGTFGCHKATDNVTGKCYILKAGASDDSIKSEWLTSEILRRSGVPVPPSSLAENTLGIQHRGNTPKFVIIQEFVEGETLGKTLTGYDAQDKKYLDQVRPYLAIHGLLGAPDFFGLCWDNIRVKEGSDNLSFHDQGMGLFCQHNGLLKSTTYPWEEGGGYPKWNSDKLFALDTPENVFEEILAILDPSTDRQSAGYCFRGMTGAELVSQINNIDPETWHSLNKSGVLSDEVYKILDARFEFLQKLTAENIDSRLEPINAKWAEYAETPVGQVSKMNSRSIPLAAVQKGLNWPAINDEKGSEIEFTFNPAGPKATAYGIIQEVGVGGVYLVVNENGKFSLPKAQSEKGKIDMWTPTCDLGLGGRLGVTNNWLWDDKNTRVYTLGRAGGSLNDNTKFFENMKDAVLVLQESGQDTEAGYLQSYLNGEQQDRFKDVVGK